MSANSDYNEFGKMLTISLMSNFDIWDVRSMVYIGISKFSVVSVAESDGLILIY
jgi:hypothetical protein